MILGLISWRRSHEKPMRSSAPGAKFSTMHVAGTRSSFVKISLAPTRVLVFSVMLRLLWLSIVKYRLSTSGRSLS